MQPLQQKDAKRWHGKESSVGMQQPSMQAVQTTGNDGGKIQ